jgi:predicted Ser/Thr protein kinase
MYPRRGAAAEPDPGSASRARGDSVPHEWQAGAVVGGRYVVIEALGAGGTGRVHRVRDLLRPRQDLALKTLSTPSLSLARAELLESEFRVMAQLSHPNIARVYDFDTTASGSGHSFTMEYVDGVDLYAATRGATVERIVDLAVQACRALAYLHSRGVIHGDFKPANVLVSRANEVKVVDFGLSDVASTGLVGTPAYMAPEMALGVADARTDLYAFGITLYQLLFRRLPFVSADLLVLHALHASSPISFPDDAIVGSRMREVVERLCAKAPARRFPNAAAVIEALADATARAYAVETLETSRCYATVGPLIGRDGPMRDLVGFCRRVAEGRCTDDAVVATVSGVSGVGKSRLLRECRRQLQLAGVSVMEAICYEGGADELEPLRVLYGTLTTSCRAQRPPGSEEVLLREHEWLSAHPAQARGGDVASEEATHAHRLRELADDVLKVAQSVGFVLVIDDLQWAGTSTVDFLRVLCDRQTARRDAGVPVKLALVASYRDDEIAGRPLAELLGAVRGARRYPIALTPLNEHETGKLVVAMLGSEELPADFGARLSAETGGNPFFVEETVRSLMERGDVYLQAGRWSARASFAALELPETIAAALEHRLSLLESRSRDLIAWLATYAQPMPLPVLAEASGLGFDAIDEGIRHLFDRQMVIAVDPARVRLAHDRLREFAYAREDAPSRRARHGAIALALDRMAADGDDYVFERAHHSWHAGDAGPAFQWCERAAALAESVFAVDLAIENHDRLRQLAQVRGDETRRRLATDRQLELLAVAGQYGRLFDLAGAELGRRTERLDLARLELLRGEALGGEGRIEAALDHLRRATALLGRGVPRSRLGRRLFIASHYLRHLARLRVRPQSLLHDAHLLPHERARREILARCYLLMSNYFQLAGDEEGAGVSTAGMNAAAGIGSTEASRKLVQNMALVHHILGQRRSAERAIREAHRAARSDTDRANVLVLELFARQLTQRPLYPDQPPVGAHEVAVLKAVEVLSVRSKALFANFARTAATILFCEYADKFRFRPEVTRWAETMRDTIHGAYIQGEGAVMAQIDGQTERAERAYAELGGRHMTLVHRASIDAHVAVVWAMTGDTGLAARALRRAAEAAPSMQAGAPSTQWVLARVIQASVVLAARGAGEPGHTSYVEDAVSRLGRVRRRLPECASFCLEVGRVALGGTHAEALERARARSRESWQREMALSSHANACAVAALAARASPHAHLRELSRGLGEEALRIIGPRFPELYVNQIDALVS